MSLIQALFLDVGGVLMTNGWDHGLRKKTAEHFGFDYEEMNSRHGLIFDTYETGKLTLDEYLKGILFYEKRNFTMKDVKEFIFNSVKPYQETIDYFAKLKKDYGLKVGIVSNEGRELAIDRIKRFNLGSFVDFFIISSFVHVRKPDLDIYRLAIDVVQVPETSIAYIDDRQMLAETARTLGIQGIHHKDLASTKRELETLLREKARI